MKQLFDETINILVITKTKMDSDFRNSQFKIEGFSIPHKFARKIFGRGYTFMFDKIYFGKLSKCY